jgi:diguanylate cyclase (GGDEF)-like protein
MTITASTDVDHLIARLDCFSSPVAAAHRLSIALAGTATVTDVSAVILRHVVGALRTGGAALAFPDPLMSFAVGATYGDGEHAASALRDAISGREGSEAALRAGRHVLIQEIRAGFEVVGIIAVANRLDRQPFTRADLALLESLSAPAALALEREAMRARADEFARAAAVDPVSGLFNRRHFQTRLEEELQRAQRGDTTIALLMIDLDNFKRINDTYGHTAGDATLRAVASIIRRSVRHFDVCTRYGGEEFAVVMPESGSAIAMSVAERILARIAAWTPTEPHLAGLRVTASIGFALSEPSHTMDDIIARADRALYEAKQRGKNQVCVAL